MNLINRLHPEIAEAGKTKGQIFIKIAGTEVYFSTGAIKAFGLKLHGFIHFIEDAKEWSFYFHPEDSTGFLLSKKSNYGLRVRNAALVKMFLKSTNIKRGPVVYNLEKTSAEYDGRRLIKIKTDSPKLI